MVEFILFTNLSIFSAVHPSPQCHLILSLGLNIPSSSNTGVPLFKRMDSPQTIQYEVGDLIDFREFEPLFTSDSTAITFINSTPKAQATPRTESPTHVRPLFNPNLNFCLNRIQFQLRPNLTRILFSPSSPS